MKDNIYQKWWFWVICGVVFITSISIIFSDDVDCPKCNCKTCQDCSQCENDLVECRQLSKNAYDAWNGYVDAFEDYCEIDYTNPLCLTIPEK